MRQDVVNIAGVGVLRGDIEADTVKCAGVGKAAGIISCRRMDVAGVFTTSNRIRAEEADIKGVLRSTADVSAEKLTVKGSVMIDAFLNAGQIDIQFERMGRVREIGAESVNIRPLYHTYKNRGGRFVNDFLNAFTGQRFKVEAIEGNDIFLENVEAHTVRGQNVVIGPNCAIGYLEYSMKAKVHDSSRVDQMKGEKPV